MHDNRRRTGRTGQSTTLSRAHLLRRQGPTSERGHALCRDALAGWLASRDWSWRYFVTLTYRDARPRRLDFIGAQLLDTIGVNADGRAVAFLCREFGGRSGRLHHHALLHGNAWSIRRLDMLWRSRYGHFDSSPYDPRKGAAGYVADYVVKADTTDVEWSFYHRQPGDDIPNIAIKKRRTGYELYCEAKEEVPKTITQVQGTPEDKQESAMNWLFPLTGISPEDTKVLRS